MLQFISQNKLIGEAFSLVQHYRKPYDMLNIASILWVHALKWMLLNAALAIEALGVLHVAILIVVNEQ